MLDLLGFVLELLLDFVIECLPDRPFLLLRELGNWGTTKLL